MKFDTLRKRGVWNLLRKNQNRWVISKTHTHADTQTHTHTHTHAHTETMRTFTTTAAHDPTTNNGYTDSNGNDHNNNDKQPELFGLVLLPDVSFFVVVYFWY